MTSTILVTGATGNVGREVVGLLADRDCHVIAAVRNPAEVQQSFDSNVRCVLFDFTNPATFSEAFAGVDRLFLLRPPALADIRKIAPALSAAKQANVEQIVFLSILGAERNRFVPHYQIERTIEQMQIPSVFLRASFFMQNLNTTQREDIRDRDRLFMPAGKGRTSFIDVRLGWAATVTSDLERLLERQPIGMQQYVEDYQQCWLVLAARTAERP